MKYVDEYRNADLARRLAGRICTLATRRWRIMEVCGGQTHTLIRNGIDEMLSSAIDPIHGPGCPVCVTPLQKIDRALAIASTPNVIFTTYGDMMRVPGSNTDLLQLKAQGADVRMVYSPTDAIKIAETNPGREVVFFAVGFETTAPANGMSVWIAEKKKLTNFSILVSHVLVPPAISTVLTDPECAVQGFIAPGHVCTIMGYEDYEHLANTFHVPFVVAGFEPLDLLEGIFMLVELLEAGRAEVRNQYVRSVRREGNREAQNILKEVFEVGDMNWRGLGKIPGSGLQLKSRFAAYDAEKKFSVENINAVESQHCIAGPVLQGKKKPHECPAFGTTCVPEHPLGAPMVSSEGACSAYYTFRRFEETQHAS